MRILTIGIKELDEEIFKTCTTDGPITNKPPFGTCLYGSTLIRFPGNYISSDWGRYVTHEYNAKNHKYGISYTLKRSARILELNDYDDYTEIMTKYLYPDKYKNQIDFYKVSQDYDAFHLTENGFWQLRLPFSWDDESEFIYNQMRKKNYSDFYSYDAETWIIFNLECINKGSILSHNALQYTDY